MSPRHIVIVGGGHAGGTLAARLRRAGSEDEVTIIGTEQCAPYHRPPLSKSFVKRDATPPVQWLYDPAFYADNGITPRWGETVTSVDKVAKQVTLTGGDTVSYDVLVLATGAEPRRLPLPGEGLEGVHTLRDLTDAGILGEAIASGKPLAIVGGGYIGLEVAAAARSMGVAVTVIEREPRILSRVASPELSTQLTERHRNQGTTIVTGAETVGFQCDRGHVGGIELADGTVVNCGTALVGAGAVPRDGLAQQIGLECSGGVIVDDLTRTSEPDILAIGDVANRPVPGLATPTGRMRLESIPNAVEQAQKAASLLLGAAPKDDDVPWFWSDQFDLKIKIAGIVHGDFETVVRGDADAGSFALFHHRDGHLIAAETVNAPKDFMAARRMLAAGKQLDTEALLDPDTDLRTLVSV